MPDCRCRMCAFCDLPQTRLTHQPRIRKYADVMLLQVATAQMSTTAAPIEVKPKPQTSSYHGAHPTLSCPMSILINGVGCRALAGPQPAKLMCLSSMLTGRRKICR